MPPTTEVPQDRRGRWASRIWRVGDFFYFDVPRPFQAVGRLINGAGDYLRWGPSPGGWGTR